MSCPPMPAAPVPPSAFALAPAEAAQGATDDGAACAGAADLLADLFATRVCPAVYRLALEQGRVPPPPPILRAWCDRRVREGEAPGLLRRVDEVGLGRALLEALTTLRVRRTGA